MNRPGVRGCTLDAESRGKGLHIYVHETKNKDRRRRMSECLYGIDWTGGIAARIKPNRIITLDPDKPLLLTDPDNREYITSVGSISGGGKTIPPMLILCGILILEKWAEENDLDEDILLATSPIGYSNDELALRWLEHFEIHSRKSQVGVWRLLILDGYGSHLTYEFYEYAQNHRIELFRLPPHSTHLTHPLDVGCFQPFKHYHAEAIDNAMRSGKGDFGKLEFLAKVQIMRTQNFKKSTIKSAFRNMGLIPYNPEVVLQKVCALPKPTRTSTPPPPDPTNEMTSVCTTTPHRPHEIKNQAHTLINSIKKDHRLMYPKFRPYLDSFIRGSVTNSLRCSIAERDLEITHRECARGSKKAYRQSCAERRGHYSPRCARKGYKKSRK